MEGTDVRTGYSTRQHWLCSIMFDLNSVKEILTPAHQYGSPLIAIGENVLADKLIELFIWAPKGD